MVDGPRSESSNPERLWIQYWHTWQTNSVLTKFKSRNPCVLEALNSVFLSFFTFICLSIFYLSFQRLLWRYTATKVSFSGCFHHHHHHPETWLQGPRGYRKSIYDPLRWIWTFYHTFYVWKGFIKTPGEVSSVNRLQCPQPMKEHLEAIRFPSFPVMFMWQAAHQRHVFWTHGTHTFQITGACQTFRQTYSKITSAAISTDLRSGKKKRIWDISRERGNTNMVEAL